MIPIMFQPRASGGDTTPGGTANAILQEDGVFGLLLEDGTSFVLMES